MMTIMTPKWFQVQLAPLMVASLSLMMIMTPVSGNKIDPEFQNTINSAPPGSTWEILVFFEPDQKLLVRPPTVEESMATTYQNVLDLEKHAEQSQSKVISGIGSFIAKRSSEAKEVETKSFYGSNALYISAASKDLIDHLADNKPEHSNIIKIGENQKWDVRRGGKEGDRFTGEPSKDAIYMFVKEAYGIQKANIRDWWEAGFNGTGVIVGHIDTGVDIHHPSLKYNWVGQGDGWLDPTDPKSKLPYESNTTMSHGTHSLGILTGMGKGESGESKDVNYYGVGVAPGARWTSCLGCRDNDTTKVLQCDARLIMECMNFMNCPSKANRCGYKPNVVYMSLGCPQTKTKKCKVANYFDSILSVWNRNAIIPVYPAGDEGLFKNIDADSNGCETVGDPADLKDVITVGNIDKTDTLYDTSSKGPPTHRYPIEEIKKGIYKPDLVAPGTEVISTIYSGKDDKFEFGYKTGTSAAAAHVAGVIALLLSRSKDWTLEDMKTFFFLKVSTVKPADLKSPELLPPACGGIPNDALANHRFGNGRIRLPKVDDPALANFPPAKAPTRQMPPPPNFEVIDSGSAKMGLVHPGIVGAGMMLMIMASTGFLNAGMEILGIFG